ncbi:sensor histidine kinase [uncultured Jatrophihabitans sp.]|uniref:sensor histidine kinase n=1 Tax=uncultured Jatrophihabitans sp. TaxID=1610747 RepID=UPI0035CCA242
MNRSLPSQLRIRPLLVDAGIAGVTALLTVLVDVLGPDYRTTGAAFWDVALAAPLVLRRRMPAVAASLIGAICLAQWAVGTLASGDAAVLVMLFSLGAWEVRRWLLGVAVLVAEIGVVLAVTRWAPPSHAWLSALMITGTVTAAWVLGVYVRTRRAYLASMIERAETAERERDTRASIAVGAERARMAREMHDIIAHSLSVMITLNDAAAAVATTDTVRDTVGQASEVGRQALAEMQRMLGVLRSGPPELAPQPGIAQLSDLVAIVRSAGLSVELSVTGELTDLAPTAQLAVYRIAQESLTNVLKHAHNVSRVTVQITNRAGHVTVHVRNDGDEPAAPATTPVGHGLAGMRERAGLYDGRFEAGCAPGGGWLVRADLHVPDVAVARR